LGAAAATLAMLPGQAAARVVTVKVDSRSAPWDVSLNPALRFGLGNARAPTVVWNLPRIAGRLVTFKASGSTTTSRGGGSFSPDGQSGWTQDHGGAPFPSHFMKADRPIHLNELVGAFVNADGKVVGAPFPIGSSGTVRAPDDALAVALGINDDNYADNSGALSVDITVTEGQVTVEGGGQTN
jgi:hypothetical protein